MPAPSAIARTDVIGIIGDSISSGFGLSDGWSWNFMRKVKSQFGAPTSSSRLSGLVPATPRVSTRADLIPPGPREATGYQAQAYPGYLMNAAPGRKCGDISATMATVLAPFIAGRTTVYVVELGQNDITVTPAATFVPQVNAIRDAIRAAAGFRMLVWCSPWTGGENWPDGANADDLGTDGYRDKETQIAAAMAAFPDCYHISWRQLRLATLNATTNPTHLVQGVYTLDGVHPTTSPSPVTPAVSVSGGDLLAAYTVSQLTFA